MSLYHKKIFQHARQPLHRGTLAKPSKVFSGKNPLCGDELTFYVALRNGIITSVAWQGSGCVISQASASMFANMLTGQKLTVVQKWTSQRLLKALEIDLSPSRVKCAVLPLYCIKEIDIDD